MSEIFLVPRLAKLFASKTVCKFSTLMVKHTSLDFDLMQFTCNGSLLTLHSFKQIDSHQSELGRLLVQEIGCQPQHILDFDLHLADTQPAASIQKCYCYMSMYWYVFKNSALYDNKLIRINLLIINVSCKRNQSKHDGKE